jgi:hypothetical protein
MTQIGVDRSTTSPASGRLSRGRLHRRLRRAVTDAALATAPPMRAKIPIAMVTTVRPGRLRRRIAALRPRQLVPTAASPIALKARRSVLLGRLTGDRVPWHFGAHDRSRPPPGREGSSTRRRWPRSTATTRECLATGETHPAPRMQLPRPARVGVAVRSGPACASSPLVHVAHSGGRWRPCCCRRRISKGSEERPPQLSLAGNPPAHSVSVAAAGRACWWIGRSERAARSSADPLS